MQPVELMLKHSCVAFKIMSKSRSDFLINDLMNQHTAAELVLKLRLQKQFLLSLLINERIGQLHKADLLVGPTDPFQLLLNAGMAYSSHTLRSPFLVSFGLAGESSGLIYGLSGGRPG